MQFLFFLLEYLIEALQKNNGLFIFYYKYFGVVIFSSKQILFISLLYRRDKFTTNYIWITNGQITLIFCTISFLCFGFRFILLDLNFFIFMHVCMLCIVCSSLCVCAYFNTCRVYSAESNNAFVAFCFVKFLFISLILSPKHSFRHLHVFSAFVRVFRALLLFVTRASIISANWCKKK